MEYNFEIWYETYDPDYVEININSRVPYEWMAQDQIPEKYSRTILKPISQYTEYMCPPPDLVSIEGNTIRLRQRTYAEIMLNNVSGEFSTIEKLWLRQYYKSNSGAVDTDACFEDGFVYFSPWMIDSDTDALIEGIPGSPFEINTRKVSFKKINKDAEFISPVAINFAFKRSGQHMKEENSWGIIRKATPIYDIVFQANDIIVERIKDFYEEE